MTEDTTHECPGPACELRVPRKHLACPRHWRQVDAETQAWVNRAYQSGDISDHVEAMDVAIRQMRP